MLLERTRLKEDSVAIRDETIRHETLGNAQDKRRLGKFRNVDSRLTRSRSSFANNELNISTIENPFAQLANLTTITPNVMLFSTITNSHAVRKNFDIEGGIIGRGRCNLSHENRFSTRWFLGRFASEKLRIEHPRPRG